MTLPTRVYMVLIYLVGLHHVHLHLDILAIRLTRSNRKSRNMNRTYTHSKSMDRVG